MKLKIRTVTMAAALVAIGAQADSFGTGTNAFTMNFVDIGDGGALGTDLAGGANAADAFGYGSVGKNYRMGMHEVTIDQFAKARAADSRIGDGNENPQGIGVNGAASNTTWYEGAKFANWLTTGDATTGAYQFNAGGTTLLAVDRDAAIAAYGTVYVLPTEDEWYKAAYFNSAGGGYTLYATGVTSPIPEVTANFGGFGGFYSTPWDVGTGAVENNGTFDMGGNVWEWNESAFDGTLDSLTESRGNRGGSFSNNQNDPLRSSFRSNGDPTVEFSVLGFRVAAIPESSSMAMIGVVSGLGLFIRRKFMM